MLTPNQMNLQTAIARLRSTSDPEVVLEMACCWTLAELRAELVPVLTEDGETDDDARVPADLVEVAMDSELRKFLRPDANYSRVAAAIA